MKCECEWETVEPQLMCVLRGKAKKRTQIFYEKSKNYCRTTKPNKNKANYVMLVSYKR